MSPAKHAPLFARPVCEMNCDENRKRDEERDARPAEQDGR